MIVTRGTRIFGMMYLFGLTTALVAGSWEYTAPATLVALIIGGFAGEAWDGWRRKTIDRGKCVRAEDAVSGEPEGPTYELVQQKDQLTIKCLRCGMTSWHPKDVEYLYCGNCHRFHCNELTGTATCIRCKRQSRSGAGEMCSGCWAELWGGA